MIPKMDRGPANLAGPPFSLEIVSSWFKPRMVNIHVASVLAWMTSDLSNPPHLPLNSLKRCAQTIYQTQTAQIPLSSVFGTRPETS